LGVGVGVRATSVCVCESGSVGVSLDLSVFSCARGCARAAAGMRVCTAASMRMCGFHVCVFASKCAGPCARTMRWYILYIYIARMCMRAFVCACECVLPFNRQASSRMCVCVRRSVCACACARAHVSVHACVRERVRVWFASPSASILSHVWACTCMRACVCVYAPRRCVGAVVAWRGPAARARLRSGAIGRVFGASAAGRTFTNRTLAAGWAARQGHTSVIDAAGAIYVIGGVGRNQKSTTYYHDVWVSTDGGARPDSVRGGGRGRYLGGTTGVLRGTHRVLQEYLVVY
jgi:hypothetical protein